jgi:hypothetical protein
MVGWECGEFTVEVVEVCGNDEEVEVAETGLATDLPARADTAGAKHDSDMMERGGTNSAAERERRPSKGVNVLCSEQHSIWENSRMKITNLQFPKVGHSCQT